MSAVAWDAIEAAIQTAVKTASGLDDGHVIFDYQNGDRPSLPYIEISIQDLGGVGAHDWTVLDDNPTQPPPAGQEVRARARGLRMGTLAFHCWGAAGSGNTPLRILSDVVSGLEQDYYALDQAGMGFGELGKPQMVPGGRAVLEPSARFEMQIHLASELVSYTTYIQYVQTTLNVTTVGGDEVSLPVWTPDPPP